MAIACRTCGNQNPDNATFCQYCGAGLQQPGQPGQSQQPAMPGPTPDHEQATQVAVPAPGQPAPHPYGQPSSPPPNPYAQSSSPPSAPPRQSYGGPPPAQPYSYGTPSTPGAMAGPEVKDPNTGLLIEMIPGFFGFMGIGWLWAGETAIGIALLVGYWIFLVVEIMLMFVLIGFCLLPFNLIAPIASAILLQRRLRERQALPVGPQPF